MAPAPGRRFPYRDGVQPALQRVHLPKGRGLPQPARAEPVPGRRPLDAARCPVLAGEARLQEVEADITDIWNTITPFNKMHLFATWFRR
jgi:hypothetical protein